MPNASGPDGGPTLAAVLLSLGFSRAAEGLRLAARLLDRVRRCPAAAARRGRAYWGYKGRG